MPEDRDLQYRAQKKTKPDPMEGWTPTPFQPGQPISQASDEVYDSDEWMQFLEEQQRRKLANAPNRGASDALSSLFIASAATPSGLAQGLQESAAGAVYRPLLAAGERLIVPSSKEGKELGERVRAEEVSAARPRPDAQPFDDEIAHPHGLRPGFAQYWDDKAYEEQAAEQRELRARLDQTMAADYDPVDEYLDTKTYTGETWREWYQSRGYTDPYAEAARHLKQQSVAKERLAAEAAALREIPIEAWSGSMEDWIRDYAERAQKRLPSYPEGLAEADRALLTTAPPPHLPDDLPRPPPMRNPRKEPLQPLPRESGNYNWSVARPDDYSHSVHGGEYYLAHEMPSLGAMEYATRRGQKPSDESRARSIPLDDVYPYREFDWTREEGRLSPEEYDALLKSMQEEGWDPERPLQMRIGTEGGMKVGEGNHRLAIAKELGLQSVPVQPVPVPGKVYRDPLSPEFMDRYQGMVSLAEDVGGGELSLVDDASGAVSLAEAPTQADVGGMLTQMAPERGWRARLAAMLGLSDDAAGYVPKVLDPLDSIESASSAAAWPVAMGLQELSQAQDPIDIVARSADQLRKPLARADISDALFNKLARDPAGVDRLYQRGAISQELYEALPTLDKGAAFDRATRSR